MQSSFPDFKNTEGAYHHKSSYDLRLSLFMFSFLNTPVVGTIGKKMLKWAVNIGLPVKSIIKATLYKQFVGGESLDDCKPIVEKLSVHHVKSILDYSVEAKETEVDFKAAVDELLHNIKFSASQPNIPFSVFKPTAFATHHILEKVSALQPLNEAEQAQWVKVQERFEKLCQTAAENKLHLMVDAEETWIQNAIDSLTEKMMEKYNKQEPYIINTIQFYRKDRLEYLKRILQTAAEKNYKPGFKIVRGAYMEKERLRASEKGYPSPIQDDKKGADNDYNKGLQICLENINNIFLVAGTHNPESCMLATEVMQQKSIPAHHPHIWFSQLYGMCDHISFNLGKAGYNVVKYIPYGPVASVTPYLIRRADENSSVGSQAQIEIDLLRKEIRRRKGNK